MRPRPLHALCAMLILFALVTAASPCAAVTLHVAADGSRQYTSIGGALNDYLPGDRIEVDPGVYTGALVIEHSVEIVATGNASETILDGEGMYRPITLRYGEGSLIQGFTFGIHFIPMRAVHSESGTRPRRLFEVARLKTIAPRSTQAQSMQDTQGHFSELRTASSSEIGLGMVLAQAVPFLGPP